MVFGATVATCPWTSVLLVWTVLSKVSSLITDTTLDVRSRARLGAINCFVFSTTVATLLLLVSDDLVVLERETTDIHRTTTNLPGLGTVTETMSRL